MFSVILMMLISGFSIWGLYRLIKVRPELFSKENLSKGLFDMGVLALILIIVIGGVAFLLRH